MQSEATPLTDEERAELESLRAEKAAREEAERAREERAELERLRAEQRASEQRAPERQVEEHASPEQRREKSIMEPGDDLSMPTGQKIVLAAIAAIVLAVILLTFFGPK